MAAVNTANFPSVASMPGKLVEDPAALFGSLANLSNLNAMKNNDVMALALGTLTAFTIPQSQSGSGILDVGGSPGAGVALTTATALQIIANAPPVINRAGFYNFCFSILNDGTAQTITLTAGVGVTLLGTMTIATNTRRLFVCNANVALGTATIMNLGSIAL